ncbi:hypothetical protein FOA52_011446 [Chlamydomonas sp. UWO 241]|nr:hypothetical protein FOA52_011446 [Chlamydomonas sp. UWO 241]
MLELKEVGTLVRYLGVNPTGAQIAALVEQLNALVGEGEVLLPSQHVEAVVANFMATQQASLFRDDYHTLIRAFRAFDPEGKGYVMGDQLKSALGSKGEMMTEDELTKMLGFGTDEEGKLYYEDYSAKLANDGRSI